MKKLLFLLFVIVVKSAVVHAADKVYGNAVVSEVTSVYDADTFRANIKGWPDIVGKRMSIRVNGVDAPEIRGKCQKEKDAARKAKQFTVAKLRNATKIKLRNMRRGKYFRILSDVYVDNNNLADLLIEAGLARPYSGGSREGWC